MAKTRRALTFTAQSVGLCWPPYLCWIFYFFVGKYYTQKVLVVFVFLEFGFDFVFESFWKKKPFLIKAKRILFIGANSPQKIKHTAGRGLEKSLGSGLTELMELAEWKGRRLPKRCGAEVNACNEGEMKCRVSR